MTRVIGIIVRSLSAGLKSMILAVLIHLLFIPLMIWSVGNNAENETVFIGFAVFIIQCILQTTIIGIVYFFSVAALFLDDLSELKKSAEQLTVRYFPLILILYIVVFTISFKIGSEKNLPFIICASIPHLIGVTVGLLFLMQELKQTFGEFTANISDQGQTDKTKY